jgi:hypothetical protein
MRNDRSFRPSYVAYQVATTYLVQPTMVTNWTYADGTRRVTLWGTPRGKVSVLWNTGSRAHTFDYPAILGNATRVDVRGATESIVPIGGAYPLDLPGATANRVPPNEQDYIIGGEPYLILEEDTMAPTRAAVDPLLDTTYGDAIQVSWDATDSQTGVWGYEVQVRQFAGSWMGWLRLAETIGKRTAAYTDGNDGERYCFRARAWDRAGNLGAWSDGEQCTTLRLGRQVRVNVGSIFGDEDGNGDRGEGERILADVGFHFVDESGEDVVTPTVASSWSFTTTVEPGDYTLLVLPVGWPSMLPGWLPWRLSVYVETGGDAVHPLEIDLSAVGLLPHRSNSFLPLAAHHY